MNILLLLVPISVVLLGIAIAAFVWAVRHGQFDNLETPPLDMLGDEPPRVDVRDDRPDDRPSARQSERRDDAG
jgi:cbb3-type cytochrome oxidase maturation protein